MKRLIFDTDLVRITTQSRGWRWTQLSDAIIAETGCCPSTARRVIDRGVQSGVLHKRRGVYQVIPADHEFRVPWTYNRLDRHDLLTALAEREVWPYTTMLSELRQRFGVAETTLRTSLTYARAYGYLARAAEGWALTPLCRQQLARYGQLEGAEGFRFAAFLSGHPKRGLQRGTV